MTMLQYKRILLKLSGEALAGEDGYGINSDMLERYAEEVKEARDLGAEVALVIGGWQYLSRRFRCCTQYGQGAG